MGDGLDFLSWKVLKRQFLKFKNGVQGKAVVVACSNDIIIIMLKTTRNSKYHTCNCSSQQARRMNTLFTPVCYI